MMTRGIAAVVVVLGLLVVLYVLTLPETPDTATTPETATTPDTELESLRQRAEQGDADAQFILGVMYAMGDAWEGSPEVVPQDYTEAVAWYRQAADQGHATAQANLGIMYAVGRGVPQDDVEAHKWTNLAASRATGDDGGVSQKDAAEARDIMATQMIPAQLAEAQQRAREWQAAFDARQE